MCSCTCKDTSKNLSIIDTVAKCQQGRRSAKRDYGDLTLILDPVKLFSTVMLNRKK